VCEVLVTVFRATSVCGLKILVRSSNAVMLTAWTSAIPRTSAIPQDVLLLGLNTVLRGLQTCFYEAFRRATISRPRTPALTMHI